MTAHLINAGAEVGKLNHQSISPEDLAERGRHSHVASLFQQAMCGEGIEVAQPVNTRKRGIQLSV